jgi:hypothetical protein
VTRKFVGVLCCALSSSKRYADADAFRLRYQEGDYTDADYYHKYPAHLCFEKQQNSTVVGSQCSLISIQVAIISLVLFWFTTTRTCVAESPPDTVCSKTSLAFIQQPFAGQYAAAKRSGAAVRRI